MSKTPIFDEFFRQRSDVVEASQTPRTVTFSYEGWNKAQLETLAGDNIKYTPPTYCGLPHMVDPNQTAPIVVTHEYPHEVQARLKQPFRRQNAITVKIDGIMSGAPVVEILAANLTAAQLCDIARAWLDADCQKWGKFETDLDKVITEHGRFD